MTRSWLGMGAAIGALLTATGLSVATRDEGTSGSEGIPAPAIDRAVGAAHSDVDTAVFAGGCFWGVQAVFAHVRGVTSVASGYAGGDLATASYEKVAAGTTEHAESVRIVYDPSQVSYGQLLQVFFSVAHDPTQLNRQGPDVGPQYRSAIWYTNAEQQRIAKAYIDQLTRAKAFARPVVTQLAPYGGFFLAEAYHQDYAFEHPRDPYIVMHDAPKLERLRQQLPELWRETPVRYAAHSAAP